MFKNMKKRKVNGNIYFLGFGCVASSLLPFIIKFWDCPLENITIIDKKDTNFYIAKEYKIKNLLQIEITKSNYQKYLPLEKGDILINLSVDISSKALVEWCDGKEALYIDTCIEPWAGVYDNPDLSIYERSNLALRLDFLSIKKKHSCTALTCHGANPGWVSHAVKQALINMAKKANFNIDEPKTKEEWAGLAYLLNIKTIHISERDTQRQFNAREEGEFVNTWSGDGMIGEGLQPAELGYGSHETFIPPKAELVEYGNTRGLIMNQSGATVKIQSYAPSAGRFQAMVITHNEAHSLSDYFSLEVDGIKYSPTVHYAYHPTDDTIASWDELLGAQLRAEDMEMKILKPEDVKEGIDELGILLMGNEELGTYWYGSQLSTEEAKKLMPNNTATALQISSSVWAGLEWILDNPNAGIVEAENIDYKYILDKITPFLGGMTEEYSDFKPIPNELFMEADNDPYSFRNFLI